MIRVKMQKRLVKCRQDFLKQYKNIKHIYKLQNGHLSYLLTHWKQQDNLKLFQKKLVEYIEFNNDA